MQPSEVQAYVIFYSYAIRACEKGEEWEMALQLFAQMQQSETQLDVISYNSAISACG